MMVQVINFNSLHCSIKTERKKTNPNGSTKQEVIMLVNHKMKLDTSDKNDILKSVSDLQNRGITVNHKISQDDLLMILGIGAAVTGAYFAVKYIKDKKAATNLIDNETSSDNSATSAFINGLLN